VAYNDISKKTNKPNELVGVHFGDSNHFKIIIHCVF
jgi:hypothetical protein